MADVPIECFWCSAKFVPWQYSQRFCSIKCQQAEYLDRTKDERNARVRNRRKANRDKYRQQDWKQHLKRYGLTPEAYNEMVDAQDGRCAICLRIPTHRLRVDHDHATNQVRQLLCLQCNLAIGYLGESIAATLNAASYLEKWGGSHG